MARGGCGALGCVYSGPCISTGPFTLPWPCIRLPLFLPAWGLLKSIAYIVLSGHLLVKRVGVLRGAKQVVAANARTSGVKDKIKPPNETISQKAWIEKIDY